eukprot:scaffold32918_cov43-Prasinocladus_malaysianus.AAC.1
MQTVQRAMASDRGLVPDLTAVGLNGSHPTGLRFESDTPHPLNSQLANYMRSKAEESSEGKEIQQVSPRRDSRWSPLAAPEK